MGKSQDDMATMCGVSREMWGKYERGVAVPGGEVLVQLALAGVDMNRLLTGHRTDSATPTARALSRRTQALVENYEATDEEGRRFIERAADLEAKSAVAGRKTVARGGQ